MVEDRQSESESTADFRLLSNLQGELRCRMVWMPVVAGRRSLQHFASALSLQRQRTWSPSSCHVSSIYSSVQGSAYTVMLIVEQPLLCSREIFQPLFSFHSGNVSSAAAAICVSHMFFFLVFFRRSSGAAQHGVCLFNPGRRESHSSFIHPVSLLLLGMGGGGAPLRHVVQMVAAPVFCILD